MKRVVVVGSGGAGKSTFSRRLADCSGLPVIHLDLHYWNPGWVETPLDEWVATVDVLLKGDQWIMDGNYGGTLERRVAACDTVIFLDRARLVCLWRIINRRIRYRAKSRPDLCPGCPERLDWAFLHWIWSYPSKVRPKVLASLSALTPGQSFVTLRSDAEANAFLESVSRERRLAP